MTISDLSNTITYSNKNVEKLAKKIINESSNAVLMEMFEDKVLLADHTNGNIYTADYKFDGTKFIFENFDNVELEEDTSSLREAIENYFEEETVDTSMLEDAIEEEFEKDDNELAASIVEALASKNIEDNIDYSELSGINEEMDELKETELFKVYSERLEENPLDHATYFDFVNPVSISLINEDEDRIIYSNINEKINKFTKDSEAKKALLEAIKEYNETEDSTVLESFVENNEIVMGLTESQLKEFVGMSIVTESELVSKRKEFTEVILNVISENEYLLNKKNIILEAANEEKDENKEDDKVAVSDSDVEKLKKALEAAAEKVEDEKLLDKINSLLSAIEESANDNETNVGAIKESIALLSL